MCARAYNAWVHMHIHSTKKRKKENSVMVLSFKYIIVCIYLFVFEFSPSLVATPLHMFKTSQKLNNLNVKGLLTK